MRNRGWEKFRTILSREVVIEYKACLYFACEVFFYFAYLLSRGIYMASMVILFEMILTAYGAGYIQGYLFHNSDEAERLERKDILGIIFCTLFYGGVSCALAWFDRSILAAVLFLIYIIFVHYFVYLANKIKRAADTEKLNKMLAEFKKENRKEKEIIRDDRR